MGFLDKLFGGSKKGAAGAVMEAPACPHTALVPRWQAAGDIGMIDRASHFICEGCSRVFTPEQARALQATASERLPGQVEEKDLTA